jgi:hypothetical protein
VRKSTLGSVIIPLVVLAALVVPFAVFRASANSYSVGAIAGLPSGFFLAVIVWWITGPTLQASAAPSKFAPGSKLYWVHIAVKNVSWNVLGSGTARECVGKVKFLGMRKLSVSWKGRPNPVREVPLTLPGGTVAVLKFADPVLFEQKRMETIRPDEPDEKWLDIAWRPEDGTEFAFVSIPEHFQGLGLTRFEDIKLGVGEHPFWLRFEYSGGESRRFYFALVNRGGAKLTSESLYIRPATAEERRKLLDDCR